MNDHAKRIAQKTRYENIVWERRYDWPFKLVMALAGVVVIADIFGWLK